MLARFSRRCARPIPPSVAAVPHFRATEPEGRSRIAERSNAIRGAYANSKNSQVDNLRILLLDDVLVTVSRRVRPPGLLRKAAVGPPLGIARSSGVAAAEGRKRNR